MKPVIFIIGIILAVLAMYGAYQTQKWINYKLAYESGVQSTIREMVKPECLKPNP